MSYVLAYDDLPMQEILRLAALGAGKKINKRLQDERVALGHGDVGLFTTEGHTCWNPITSGDTALYAAADRKLNIEFGNDGRDYTVAWDGCIGSGKCYHDESDRHIATRWAITLSLVQIGQDLERATASV